MNTLINPQDNPLESTHLLAGHMIAGVTHDAVVQGLFDLGELGSFEALHLHVDANEYVIAAAHSFDWDFDLEDDDDMEVIGAASSLVSDWLREQAIDQLMVTLDKSMDLFGGREGFLTDPGGWIDYIGWTTGSGSDVDNDLAAAAIDRIEAS